MEYNAPPKASFCKESKNVTEHHVLVENPIVRRSIDTALSEYQRRQSRQQVNDLGGAASCFLRMQGAYELVDILYNLAETEVAAKAVDSMNLPSNTRSQNTIPLTRKG